MKDTTRTHWRAVNFMIEIVTVVWSMVHIVAHTSEHMFTVQLLCSWSFIFVLEWIFG